MANHVDQLSYDFQGRLTRLRATLPDGHTDAKICLAARQAIGRSKMILSDAEKWLTLFGAGSSQHFIPSTATSRLDLIQDA